MSKKLLAAALAAAFLATGGVARAADEYQLDKGGSSWTTKINNVSGTSGNPIATIAPNTAAASGVLIYSEDSTKAKDGKVSGTISTLAGAAEDENIEIGTKTTGSYNAGNEINLTADSLVVGALKGRSVTIYQGSTLTTKGESTVGYNATTKGNSGTLEIANGGTYINDGKLTISGILEIDDDGIAGKLKNTGTVIIGSSAAFVNTNDYGIIDNSGTKNNLQGTMIIDAAVADAVGDADGDALQSVITAIVKGGSKADLKNDIGDVYLKGVDVAGTDLAFNTTGASTATTSEQALAGNVYLGTDTESFAFGAAGAGTDEEIEAHGANLIIKNVNGSNNNYNGNFAGRNVYFEQGLSIDGTIIAHGGKEGLALGEAGGGDPSGLVVFNAKDGNIIEVNSNAIQGGRLEVYSNGSSLGFTGNQVKVNDGTVYHNGGDIDLSGVDGLLEGGGIFDNSGLTPNAAQPPELTIDGKTTFDPNSKIYNIAASNGSNPPDYVGLITTDGLGLANVANIIKVDTIADPDYAKTLGGGFGTIDVVGNSDINANIAWGATKEGYGDLFWGDATKALTLSGNIDLGDGVIHYGTDADASTDAQTRIISSGSVVKAFLHDVDTNVSNAGTMDGGLDIADTKTITNTGSILVGVLKEGEKAGSPEVITVNATGKIDNSQGYMNIGSNAEFEDTVSTIAGSIYNNGEGANGKAVIDISADIRKDGITNFTTAINTANTNGEIGRINVNGNMQESFNIVGANEGLVTLNGTQNSTGVNVNVGTADLEITGEGNKMKGNIAAGSVDFSSAAGGAEYNGTVTAKAKDGDITIAGADTFTADMSTWTGDVNIASGATVAKVTAGDVTGSANPNAYGNVVAGSGVTFTGDVTAKYDAVADDGGDISATNSTFAGKVIAEKDLVAVNNTFADDVTADTIKKGITGSTFLGTLDVANGDVKTYGSTESFFGDTVTINNGKLDLYADSIFISGITLTDATKATTVYSGKTATIGGTLNTDFFAKTGSTVNIANQDVTANRLFDMDANSTLDFKETLNPKTLEPTDQVAVLNIGNTPDAYVNLDNDIRMLVDSGLNLDIDDHQLLISGMELDATTGTTYTNFSLSDNPLTTIEDVNAFLDEKSFETFNYSGAYGFVDVDNPTEIQYQHTVATPETREDQFNRAMDKQGMTGREGIISDNTYNTLSSEFNDLKPEDMAVYEAMEDTRAGDIAKVLNGAAGGPRWYDVKNRPDLAYAVHQWSNGQDIAGALEAVQDTVRSFNRAISNRAYNIGGLMNQTQYDECGQPIADCGGYKNRVWAGYTGQWGKRDSSSWDTGYKYDAHGFNLGYDHVTSSGVGFGAAFGYSKGDFENRGALASDSDIDNYSFGLFASYNHCSGFFTTISGTYTYSDYNMKSRFADASNMRGQTAGFTGWDNADFHGDTWSVGGKLGYDLKPVANLTITPTMGLYYYNTRTNTFGTSAGRYGMKYRYNNLELPVEVTAKYDIAVGCDSTLSFVATAGYAYNFNNKGVRQNAFFTVASEQAMGGDRFVKPGRSSWNVGGGAQFRYRNFDVGVNYEYYGRKDYRSHNLNANVGVSF